jgi:hypothetical protein
MPSWMSHKIAYDWKSNLPDFFQKSFFERYNSTFKSVKIHIAMGHSAHPKISFHYYSPTNSYSFIFPGQPMIKKLKRK